MAGRGKATPPLQPFSQKSLTVTVPKVFQIGLCGVVVADLELFCNSWSVGFLGERLYLRKGYTTQRTTITTASTLWSGVIEKDGQKGRRRSFVAGKGRLCDLLRAQPPMSILAAYEPPFSCNVWIFDWWES